MAEISKNIEKAKELLTQGQVVGIPTETVYGLAANALNPQAVARVFEVKKRPHFDPLIIHLYDASQLDDFCEHIPPLFYTLYQRFSPGPITYILNKKSHIPDLVTAGQKTVGIRFPRHPLTRELLSQSRMALAAPSANPFGYVSPTTAQHVQNQLGSEIPLILDGGACLVGIESTIIDLSKEEPEILRLGGLALSDIEPVTGSLKVQSHSSSNPKAPGMLSAHYAPGKPLIIGNIEELLGNYAPNTVGIISLFKSYPLVPEQHQKVLSPSQNLREAAAQLFSALRELDTDGIEIILAEKMPEKGLGPAINDRLQRAAASN